MLVKMDWPYVIHTDQITTWNIFKYDENWKLDVEYYKHEWTH